MKYLPVCGEHTQDVFGVSAVPGEICGPIREFLCTVGRGSFPVLPTRRTLRRVGARLFEDRT